MKAKILRQKDGKEHYASSADKESNLHNRIEELVSTTAKNEMNIYEAYGKTFLFDNNMMTTTTTTQILNNTQQPWKR
jgi:hypothetical protein